MFTLTFLCAVATAEIVGLGWVLVFRKKYQVQERKAYGFPSYRLPLWAKAYWTTIAALLLLALHEIQETSSHVPAVPAIITIAFSTLLVVKWTIYVLFPNLRDKLVTQPWPKIAISKILTATLCFVGLGGFWGFDRSIEELLYSAQHPVPSATTTN